MQIHNDAAGRVVMLGLEDEELGVPAFHPATKHGAVLCELLGAPVSTWFATANVLPVDERRSMPRNRYGIEARLELADRSVIVVGKETAALLFVADSPLMIWLRLRWSETAPRTPTLRDVAPLYLPGIHTAAFPTPSARSTWWRDPENVDVAQQWLEEQRGVPT